MIKKVESPGKKRGRPPRLGERDFSTGIVSTWKLYTKGGNIGRPTFRPVFSRINREFFLLLLFFFSLPSDEATIPGLPWLTLRPEGTVNSTYEHRRNGDERERKRERVSRRSFGSTFYEAVRVEPLSVLVTRDFEFRG